MGKLKKKGEAGAARNFISRNQAVKKLQVTLADFRRLCILKGIYPREPRNKKKANKGSTAPTTFYYAKDVQYLLHEPVLDKFRQHKIFARKLSRAIGKHDLTGAKRLESNRPTYTLDHIVKERYPTFADAVHDLDDALSTLFLFATMPTTDKISETIVANCDRLCREFEGWVVRARALRKVFLSIKGIYYRAEVDGQEVTWLVPYRFSQKVPTDVDFRIMLTFLEFYQTFVGFVNYRLYSGLGLVYPPRISAELDEDAGGLASLSIERPGAQDGKKRRPKKVRKQIATLDVAQIAAADRAGTDGAAAQDNEDVNDVDTDDEDDEDANGDDIDDFDAVAPRRDTTSTTTDNLPSAATTSTNLFSGLTFYLSREVPRWSLEFVLRSFGASVSWDASVGGGSVLKEDDPAITHHVCDRPTQASRHPGRAYLQPQWVYDSVNKGTLQSLDAYAPGAILPPHLSPFVRLLEGQYDPTELVPAVEGEEAEEEDESEEEAVADAAGNGEAIEAEDDDDDDDEEEVDEEEVEHAGAALPKRAAKSEIVGAAADASLEVTDEDDEEEVGGEVDPEEMERSAEQRQLEAEAAGIPFSEFMDGSSGKKAARAGVQKGKKQASTAQLKAEQAQRRADEELALRKGMMSNKNKRLYERMTFAKRQREDEASELRKRRKALAKKA